MKYSKLIYIRTNWMELRMQCLPIGATLILNGEFSIDFAFKIKCVKLKMLIIPLILNESH